MSGDRRRCEIMGKQKRKKILSRNPRFRTRRRMLRSYGLQVTSNRPMEGLTTPWLQSTGQPQWQRICWKASSPSTEKKKNDQVFRDLPRLLSGPLTFHVGNALAAMHEI
ncbi:hypothetical protein SLE2022_147110 [Rubroshorea leprosula]